VEVRFRRADLAGWTSPKAQEFLKLRSKSTERLVVLDWTGNNIRQYEDAWQLIAEFVTWRLDWYRVRYQKLIADTTKLLNWNLALQACMDKGLPAFLGKAANRAEIVDKIAVICTKIPLDADQIDRIAGLASHRWARDNHAEIVAKIAELTQTIADYHTVLNDPRKIRSIYREEVAALKKLPAVR
jgi:DNA gyrase/topoisomerase IV subunit A